MQALDGIRVLDIGGTVATGYLGKLFADHGATVIDVEPVEGFETRRLQPYVPDAEPGEQSAMHRWLSTNKKSTTLPVDRLIDAADVLVTSQPAQELEAMGITTSALARRAPNLVWSSVTWFGLDGPYSRFAGSDAVVHSLAGMVRGIGRPDRPPMLPTGYQAQVIGGLTAFIGTMAQVLARELGNADGLIRLDTSILEANLCFTEVGAVAGYGQHFVGKRLGVNRFPPTYPLGWLDRHHRADPSAVACLLCPARSRRFGVGAAISNRAWPVGSGL